MASTPTSPWATVRTTDQVSGTSVNTIAAAQIRSPVRPGTKMWMTPPSASAKRISPTSTHGSETPSDVARERRVPNLRSGTVLRSSGPSVAGGPSSAGAVGVKLESATIKPSQG